MPAQSNGAASAAPKSQPAPARANGERTASAASPLPIERLQPALLDADGLAVDDRGEEQGDERERQAK